jgi:chemotaxis protein histidine kinase CheA
MSSDVINVVIRARDEATAALLGAGRAADALAEAQAAAAETGAAMEGQAAETADALREQAAAAQAAAAKTGSSGGAGGSSGGIDTPDHLKRTAAAADNAAGSVSNLSGRVMALRYNLMDVGQQLAGGGSPFMVLMQQGPEIVGALGDATEAAEVLKAAFGPLIAGATSLATVLAAVGVAAAALGATYAVVANQTEVLYSDLYSLRGSAEAASAALDRVNAAAVATSAGVAALSRASRQSTDDLGMLVGTLDKYEVAAKRKLAAMEAEQRANVLAATQAAEATRREMEAQRALSKSKDAKVEERVAAQQRTKALEAELAASQAVADAAVANLDTMRQNIALEAEYLREQEASNAALDARAERQRAAAQATREAAAANEAAAEAAAQWARDQSMINAAAQDLAALIPDLVALPQILEDAAIEAMIASASKGLEEVAKELEGLVKTFGAMVADQIRKAVHIGSSIGEVLGGNISGVLSDAIPAIGAKLGQALGNIAGDGIFAKLVAAIPLIGEAMAAALSGIEALGNKGAKATSDEIVKQIRTLIKGFSNLPALLVELIPDLIVKVIPDLIVALVSNIPRLLVALVIELPVAIIRGIVGWWRDIGGFRGIATSIADGVRDWWRETWDRVRGWLQDIFTIGDSKKKDSKDKDNGSSAWETVKDTVRTAIAVEGELSGRSRTSSRQRPGPQIVLQTASLHPDVVPSILRDLDRQTRPGGLRRGTTGLGGA